MKHSVEFVSICFEPKCYADLKNFRLTIFCIVLFQEIRLAQDPFPLYPGEILKKSRTPLTVVNANSALRLRAVLDFTDEKGKAYVAGDEWLFEGPGTYIPKKEVEVVETVRASIIRPNQAIKLRARKETEVSD